MTLYCVKCGRIRETDKHGIFGPWVQINFKPYDCQSTTCESCRTGKIKRTVETVVRHNGDGTCA